jgi:tripartite-type tricarboxylate transporter receptor subunit TctC
MERAIALRAARSLLVAVLLLMPAARTPAQDTFPAQSLEIIVPFGPGGGADAMSRKIAQLLEPILGVPILVSNTPGASGNAGLTKLLINPADGYTLAMLNSLTVSAWAAGVGYVKPDDFVYLAIVQQSPSMLFVPDSAQFKTFTDLLDFAKANPAKLKVATAGYGLSDDVTLRYFASLGYKMVGIPYAKPAERYASPFGRRTQALYEEPGDVANLLSAKRLRPLVVFDSKRHFAFPDVPSSKELGFEISDLPNFRMLVVRAATPADRAAVLVQAIDNALDTSEWKKYCADTYSCTAKYTPQQAKQRVKDFHEAIRRLLARI